MIKICTAYVYYLNEMQMLLTCGICWISRIWYSDRLSYKTMSLKTDYGTRGESKCYTRAQQTAWRLIAKPEAVLQIILNYECKSNMKEVPDSRSNSLFKEKVRGQKYTKDVNKCRHTFCIGKVYLERQLMNWWINVYLLFYIDHHIVLPNSMPFER